MAVTSILGPNSDQAIGTGLGDGTTYSAWSLTSNIHQTSTGSTISLAFASNAGHLWFNIFNSSQIPSDATINGVELIAGPDFDGAGNGAIAKSGNDASSTFTLKFFLYNGSAYSSALTILSGGGSSHWALANSDTELVASGSGFNYYPNSDSTADVIAGSASDLSGLSWNPANQADFGFAVTNTNESGAISPVLFRGMGLRITYTEVTRYPNEVIGVASTNILKIYGVATENVSFRSTPGNTIEPAVIINLTYQFESETNVTSTADWVPSGSSAGWVNGSSAVDGSYWGRTSNKTVKGWNMDNETTGSGNTGPNGGVDPSDGSHVSAERYMYTEVTGQRHLYAFVARLAIPEMNNTSNDLDLKFWVHAFGAAMGDLYIYIDDASTSNHSSATELAAYETFSGFTATSSVWQQKTISLNSYRDNSTDYYIYFVSQNGTGFTSDLAIDAVQLIES